MSSEINYMHLPRLNLQLVGQQMKGGMRDGMRGGRRRGRRGGGDI